MKDLKEMDEHTQEALLHVAVVINTNAQEIRKRMSEAMQAVAESVAVVAEQIGDVFAELPEQIVDVFAELPDMPRTPPKIKKDIKHEKNPMRLKQLNKELNESYKAYKRK